MSDMEYHKGTAKEICQMLPTFKEKVENAINVLNLSYEEIDWEAEQLDSKDMVYFEDSNRLFWVQNTAFDEPFLKEAELQENGTFTYFLGFYNGGTCFSEALASAITTAEKDIVK